MNRTITPSILPKPRGYSHGVSTTGTVLYVAGQVAHDTTGRMVSSEFAAQFAQCIDNVLTVVRTAGGGSENVVKLVAYVTDIGKYRECTRDLREVWKARFGNYYPAMTLVAVSALIEPSALVELEGIAHLP
jgi:enamine deaminase RidA (YjgF/YER057c/UK114 family)